MVLTLVLLLIVGLLNFLFGLLVLARDNKKTENISFSVLGLGIFGWAIGIAGFLGQWSLISAHGWIKIYYFFPIIIVLSSVIFGQYFSIKTTLPKIINGLFFVLSIILSINIFFNKDFLIQAIIHKSYGPQVVLNPTGYILYSIYLLICFATTFYLMYRKSRVTHESINRQQLYIFLTGYTLACIIGLFFNLLLPGLGNYSLIVWGPIGTSILVFAVGYAMIKHRLFDIRFVIVRSLAYSGTLIIVVGLYGFIAFELATLLFHVQFPVKISLLLSLLTGLFAFTFQSFKRFFDKTTTRLFYRDLYDPQELYNEINKILVSTVSLSKLLNQTSKIIKDTLKVEFCTIGIKDETELTGIAFYGDKLSFEPLDVHYGHMSRSGPQNNVIAVDYMGDSLPSFKNLLTENDIAAFVSLTRNTKGNKEDLGYILVGQKKSGSPYSTIDTKALDTLANEIVIGMQNTMYFEQVQHFNETLQQRITEATRKLRNANQRLKSLDSTKNDFISMASHQLRTPLTSIKGYLSMITDEDIGKITPAQKRILNQAYTSVQKMVFLVTDLLNVSRIQTGKFVLELTDVNLKDLAENEIAQLQNIAATRDQKLELIAPEVFPTIKIDESKIRQVVMNYIDNALYYTPKGGKVTISLFDHKASVELRVSDQGIGVPKEAQKNLFTKFYRAENARRVRPDGTGIGLFLAKEVINAHGGSILFQSSGIEGKGSVFGFVLPKKIKRPQ